MAPGDGVEINVPPGPPHYQGIAPPLPPGHHLPPVPDPRDPRDTLGDRVPDDRILADEYQDRVRRDRYERNGYYRRKRHRHYRRHHGGHRRRRRRRKRHHEEHGEQGQHRPHGEEGSGDDESSSKKSHKSKKKSSDSDSDSKSDSSSSGGRIFTKKKVAKAGLATLLAFGVGLAAKKLLSSKKKKKERAKLESGGGTEGDSDNEGGAEDESLPGYYADPVYRPPPIPATSLFNVRVPPNQVCIVERGGRYHRKLNSGSNFVNPVSDKIAYCHSMKELAVPVPWQECFSSDNVPFRANAMLYMRVEDPVAASYSVDNPYHSIVLLAQTLIRNQMARYTKERGFQDRIRIGDRILDEINDTCRAWGVRCLKFELRDLEVPMEIQERLEEEEEEERQHRMAELQAEADRIEAVNTAEAEFQAQVKASQARQLEIVNQAIGEAHAIEERGEAVANALRGVAQVVNEPGGQEAMQMRLAERFIDAYSRATSAPTVAPPNPSNVASNMNNAIGLLNTLGDNDPSVQIPNIPMRASANPFVEKPKVPSRPKPTARPGHKKPVGYPGSPQQSEIPAPVKVVGPITATAKVHESDLSSESDRRSHVESDDPKSKIQNAKLKPRIASSHARPGRAAPRRGSNPESLSDSRESRRRPASSTPPRSDQKAKPKPHAHKDTLKKIQAGLEDKFGSIQDTVEGLIDRF
ncbi:unnamed protein product [Chondrus crispus]|uniref:Band 7 domain-containing protein n=1 Tax=Chondrus crispus TaxID=2769 RepID=R7QCD3_CHOCR|nr:unnamed protein product [Chondrus crispus]CDF35120.1 unnamed protein product [Chondrus crispus]|eukprot:XP_005714939.1 unnamed protein product [Chondrus crispus]